MSLRSIGAAGVLDLEAADGRAHPRRRRLSKQQRKRLRLRRRRLRRKRRRRRQRQRARQQRDQVQPLDGFGHHVIERFSYGYTPALASQVSRAGGGSAWFEQQLSPGRVPDAAADQLATWWPSLQRTPAEIAARNASGTEGSWVVMQHLARLTLLRRMTSQRQVHETMVDFWSNHLYVPAMADAESMFRVDYDRVVRQHALGRFEDLLASCITHPAMLCYLDGARSSRTHPNENLGRELLELHTVGVEAGYTEADVRDSARILTGWRVDTWGSWRYSYEPQHHATGPVRVLGFTDANGDPDGRATCSRYLSYLARHPLTARRIARRLATRFVVDDPPEALVTRLAAAYLAAGTDIRPVLRTLVASAEFRAAAGRRTRTFGEDVIATYRALDVRVARPGAERDAANAVLWQAEAGGGRPFAVAHPAGDPEDGASWSSVARLLTSLRMHGELAGGWWPRDGVTYRTPASWVPHFPIRLDHLVDHLCRTLLGRPATPRMVTACCTALSLSPSTAITRQHGVIRWHFWVLLNTILDSPEHLTR